MVSDSLRPRVQRVIDSLSAPFMRFTPNSISAASFIIALLAGYLYFRGSFYLLLSFAALLFSSVLDAVDGNVARKRHMQGRKGDLVDHVLDRFSDIAILAGMAFSAFGSLSVGFFALEGVMITSYMGTQSQALGLKRDYSGIMGRSDRLILMMVFALLQYFIPFNWNFPYLSITPTILLLLVFAVAGNITAVTRFARSYKAL